MNIAIRDQLICDLQGPAFHGAAFSRLARVHSPKLLRNGRCVLRVAALCSGEILPDALEHGLMRFLVYINIGEIILSKTAFVILEHKIIHHRSAAVGFRNCCPVDFTDSHIVVIVDRVEVVLVYHYGMILIMVLAVIVIVPAMVIIIVPTATVIIVDIYLDDSRGAPVIVAVVGLIRGKGHPADIGFRIDP
jgi:hypothetical protein